MKPLRLLMLDIETSPLTAHIWRPTDTYVPMERLIQDSYMINWGAKWAGSDEVMSGLVTPSQARRRDDSKIVPPLAALIREADYAVGHNIDGFDWPRINARVAALDLEPLGPVKTIDTYKLAKRNLQIAYNKLDYLGEYLGVGRKIKTDMDLWLRCMAGEQSALNAMQSYNVQDVLLLEAVFERLKPHVRSLPRLQTSDEPGDFGCPHCGAPEASMRRKGYYYTQASQKQRYRCEVCGRYSRSRETDKRQTTSLVPL